MANVVVIENDPRVKRQIEQFLGELEDDQMRVRFFDNSEQFEARYFNKANLETEEEEQVSPLNKLPETKNFTKPQIDWLLEHGLATESPVPPGENLFYFNLGTHKITRIEPQKDDNINYFSFSISDVQTKVDFFESLVPPSFQSTWNQFLESCIKSGAGKTHLPLLVDSGSTACIFKINVISETDHLVFKLVDVTNKIKNQFNSEKNKINKQAEEDDEGVTLDLLGHINLIIFKKGCVKDFKLSWVDETLKKIDQFGLNPPNGQTRMIITKYEDDNFDKMKLLNPKIDDLIYIPLDRLLFLQKIDTVLTLPARAKPSFLFSQDVEMSIDLCKRTDIEFVSDLGIAIRNPVRLQPGLFGHFYFKIPGEERKFDLYAKAQVSKPHPEHPKEYVVYFTFVALNKNDQTELRKFISKNPRYQNLKSEDREDFRYNPDNLFANDEDRRIKNIIVIDPDEREIEQLADNIKREMDQVKIVGDGSYYNFLKKYFSKEKGLAQVDLSTISVGTSDDFYSESVEFLVDKETMNLKRLITGIKQDSLILGHPAGEVFEREVTWQKHLFPTEDEKNQLEEAFEACWQGRQIVRIVIATSAKKEHKAITMTLVKKADDAAIQVELAPAQPDDIRQKAIMNASIDTIDAIVIDKNFVPTDIDAWIEGLSEMCRSKGLFPHDGLLKVFIVCDPGAKIDPRMYKNRSILGIFHRPLELRSFLLNLSLALHNNFTIYNFENIGWLETRMPVHVAREVQLQNLSEFGASVRLARPIAPGTFLFLRRSIFDNAPNNNLCGRFFLSEEDPNEPGQYLCHLLYYGINESFMKFARSWFRENYAASKQQGNG